MTSLAGIPRLHLVHEFVKIPNSTRRDVRLTLRDRRQDRLTLIFLALIISRVLNHHRRLPVHRDHHRLMLCPNPLDHRFRIALKIRQ